MVVYLMDFDFFKEGNSEGFVYSIAALADISDPVDYWIKLNMINKNKCLRS